MKVRELVTALSRANQEADVNIVTATVLERPLASVAISGDTVTLGASGLEESEQGGPKHAQA